jgi:UDP-2-acetamido-2,6-beta-L-arabino-hexul-4-ose reductase
VLSSSSQASKDNAYGVSKKLAEDAVTNLVKKSPAFYYRLPNVFGKWSKPNYNSAVATFCHNIANDLPIQINDPKAVLNLVYIDDVITSMLDLLKKHQDGQLSKETLQTVEPVYTITVGELTEQIKAFKESRSTLVTEDVGVGLVRALHATYLSFLKPGQFSYTLPKYGDPRGVFVEMLKTKTGGQFSFFTAHPGITRGGHYHHTKTEKFLVIKGKARYKFRHLITNEFYELVTDDSEATVVETIPGWSHDITNIGTEELIVMLWANEIFDRQKPDTISHEV